MDTNASTPFFLQVLQCLGWYLCYILPFAAVLLGLRLFTRVPDDVFRKLLHCAAFTSAPVIVWLSGSWQVAVAVLVLFGAIVWPALVLAERLPGYAEVFVEKGLHEVRRSLLLLFWGNALVVGLCAGLFGRTDAAVAGILMWGAGDAAAALVGRRLGKHRVQLPFADSAKTWEGSAACAVTAFVVGLATYTALGQLSTATVLRVAVAAVVGAYVELISHKGMDTITVPLAIAGVLVLLGNQ